MSLFFYLKSVHFGLKRNSHSLSEVDLPYFAEIIKNLDLKKTKWNVSYHEEKDKELYRQVLISLNVPDSLIVLDKMDNLCDPFKTQYNIIF